MKRGLGASSLGRIERHQAGNENDVETGFLQGLVVGLHWRYTTL